MSAVSQAPLAADSNSIEQASSALDAASSGVQLTNLSLTYNQGNLAIQALERIDLSLEPDDFVCVLGPSGCGKSSLLNIIAGYLKPSSGYISIDGEVHTRPTPQVGVVFQHANLFPWLSAAGNVEFGLRMAGMPRKERKQKAARCIEMVGLESAASRLPHQLSGGMKQRAALARTLATEPRIVLMDEPFSALDALTRESMQLHVRQIWQQTRRCFFFITHDVDEALLLGRRIIVMQPNPGRIVQDFSNPLLHDSELPAFQAMRANKDFTDLRQHLLSLIAGSQTTK